MDKIAVEPSIWTWLYSQGVSTVLLVLILWAIYRIITTVLPKHVETVQEGYERMGTSHKEVVVHLTETFRKERELERQQSAATNQAIRELTEQMRENRK